MSEHEPEATRDEATGREACVVVVGAEARLDAVLGRIAPRTIAVLLFVACVAVYASNGKTIGTGDSIPARLIPIALVLDGTTMLDRFADVPPFVPSPTSRPYFVHRTPYGVVSFYPIATGLLATPIVAPAVLWIEHAAHPDAAGWIAIGERLEKVAAMVLVAASVVVFHSLLRGLGVGPALALLVTLTYAFGSQAYGTSSQALWQHGPGCLALVGALLCLVRTTDGGHRARGDRARSGNAAMAGFSALAAVAVAVRPNNLVLVFPLALVALWIEPRRWLALLVPAALIGALLAAYNLTIFSSLLGGYGIPSFVRGDLVSGLAGLLVSPGRGLLVYFPVTLVLLALLALEPPAFAKPLPLACLTAVAATILLTAGWRNWWGGYSYGPRLLTETQPLILLLVALGITATRRPVRRRALVAAVAVLLPLQIAIQAIGTYGPPGRPPAAVEWNAAPVSIDAAPARNWSIRDCPIARGLRGLVGYD